MTDPTARHAILAAASVMDQALKSVADTNPTFMATDDKAAALVELSRIGARVTELRLRVLADAADVADATGARDAASWLAHQTHARFEDARADLRLATTLDRDRGVVATALREGRVNTAQARVIVRALDALPDDVPADVTRLAEETLVGYAADFDPRELARLGRHVLEVVAPDLVDAAEGRRLEKLEVEAHSQTRLTLRRLGDGTTRLSGRLPDASATRLATYLEAFANPRKAEHADPGAEGDLFTRLPYPRRLGEALCQFLETIDPARLPIHGGDATTVVVTVSLEALRAEVAAATLLGGGLVPGDDLTGDTISASDVRRLARNAKILPAVLGGQSEVLDLGRARRIFTPPQRRALLIRDGTCRAEGCDIPGTWSEAHHWIPWTSGGLTDIVNAVLLCSHHHHRAHDSAYQVERLPNGDVRFNLRR
ncbi:HNH endonuclease signature motif containing protein [Nocardioides sp.]|uniref:HNH endonuclease signature motif containing protein n=1 Tax=Nocardioides sp. TaxID=35761 RepID=UPI002BB4D415|nr:DUF222 domain-containing protein [Nocardioides sp.]HXH80845.1 DUF222 domain-containing protein [Nocardioides sp.]